MTRPRRPHPFIFALALALLSAPAPALPPLFFLSLPSSSSSASFFLFFSSSPLLFPLHIHSNRDCPSRVHFFSHPPFPLHCDTRALVALRKESFCFLLLRYPLKRYPARRAPLITKLRQLP
ncbi:uncharacterized protein AKAW2_20851S [Aspergillus luchuensis]|uniref:Secreted protein n=1 Tax=Aspergillus kawachii TaxID=1069201 RepID=A0A7R7W422_ASPKA|nr:uncharacterized protein AKAW2_20851S [Aspergillus luchuensis]BCR95911.1 hypothetical protein AKAW2_20851S [Aspergillus luchuensis]